MRMFWAGIVQEGQIGEPGFDLNEIKIDPQLTRLPVNKRNWKGFLNPKTGAPYDFETEVRNFKSFESVGGGIHMGGTAKLSSPQNLTDFVLRYDVQTASLLLVGPKDEQFIYRPVEPDVLKALYKFALSGHNNAISIGWSGTVELQDKIDRQQEVLLDPSFVDTRIGQDLFLADKLPWGLNEETLPNRRENPIAKDFDDAQNEFDTERLKLRDALISFFEGVRAFAKNDKYTWIARFPEDDTVVHTIVRSLLQSEDRNEVRQYFLDEIGLDENTLESLQTLAVLSDEGTQALEQIEELLQLIDSLPADIEDARYEFVSSMVIDSLEIGQADKNMLQLWYALIRQQDPDISPQEMASQIWILFPNTSLAVLIDEPTTIEIQKNSIILKGTMRYRYATSFVVINESGIYRTHAPNDPENEVRELSTLTTIANKALPNLESLYPPLQRVGEYARIVAFLRWALQEGNLIGIDFSSLSAYPASDTEHFPTPDAIIY